MRSIFSLQYLFIFILLSGYYTVSTGQSESDSIKIQTLSPVTIQSWRVATDVARLNAVIGTYLVEGKKNEVISLDQMSANVTEKTARQIFAKVPGIFVYDMDGAGNQINIATRGLDPHRGWEFNIRKDGVITNSDMYAYPASHYSLPMESIDRIELVRGTGSLQYGAQFGGMLNYVTKQPDSLRRIAYQSYNTLGSYHLLSTYHNLNGTLGKWNYYAYFAKRSRDGYRRGEHTDYDAEGLIIHGHLLKSLAMRAEWSRSNYLYKIPGPLSDAMFESDPRQASRTRNYFMPAINIPSLRWIWTPSKSTTLELTSSAVIGKRNSVMFDKPATTKDSINASTLTYNLRQVDIDHFNSYTNELRVLQKYNCFGHQHILIAGAQVMYNDLHRTQQGKGSAGSDYDLDLVDPNWGRDIHLKSNNTAVFAENSFKLIDKLTINFGARMEIGKSEMSGKIVYLPNEKVPLTLDRKFALFGGSLQYSGLKNANIYAGIAQTYRPMIFKDLVPSDAYEKVDPDLKDANGYNADFGIRGKYQRIQWDISGFLLQYNHRFGILLQQESNGEIYTLRTNIGDSRTIGTEIFVQGKFPLNNRLHLTLFTSTTLMDAKYIKGSVKSGNQNVDINGNKVESAPDLISRNGVTLQYKSFALSVLYSYTSSSFADALNTNTPSASGSVGLVPSYGLLDINCSFPINKYLRLRTNFNNVFNKQYFTKRPLFYPGPGIWPSDGRNASVSFVISL